MVAATTPRALVARLNAGRGESAAVKPDLRDRFAALGAEDRRGSPDEFAGYIKKEIPKLTKVVKEFRCAR